MTADERRNYGLLIGLLTGTFFGASLAMWFAPQLRSELRQRLTDSASKVGNRASDRYQQVSARLGDAVDHFTNKGQRLRDDVGMR
jgi:gas vesicle protein